MRIHGFGTSSVEERERAKTESATPSSGTGSDAKTQASVVVSHGAQQISAAVSRSDSARSQRVAEVRAQVQAGTYSIDRDKLAAKIADDELLRQGRA